MTEECSFPMKVKMMMMMLRQEMPSPWQLYHIESLHCQDTAVVLEAVINGTFAEIECG